MSLEGWVEKETKELLQTHREWLYPYISAIVTQYHAGIFAEPVLEIAHAQCEMMLCNVWRYTHASKHTLRCTLTWCQICEFSWTIGDISNKHNLTVHWTEKHTHRDCAPYTEIICSYVLSVLGTCSCVLSVWRCLRWACVRLRLRNLLCTAL